MLDDKRKCLKGLYFIFNIGQDGFNEIPLWLEGIMANGAGIIQVRGKDIHTDKLASMTCDVIRLAKRYDGIVIVNDYPEIARAAKAHGVHLGAKDTSIIKARNLLGGDFIIGATVRNVEQAGRAIRAGADYIAVGSVFKSPTKPSAPVVGLDVIASVKRRFPGTPLCAIGGINTENIMSVKQAGADMAAVISAITTAANPEKTAFKLSAVLSARLPTIEEEDLCEFDDADLDD
jgi:thiamine-phosphate diphosphorylase